MIVPYIMPKRTEAEVCSRENFDVTNLMKYIDKRNEEVGISEVGCFEASGCYAFLRYEAGVKKATDFADVYVGGSPSMGASIMRHLEGNGNPDVYADVKYHQNVRVLLFPYPQEMLRIKSRQLIDVLGADDSYNARNHRCCSDRSLSCPPSSAAVR